MGNGIVGDGVLDVPAVKLTKYGDICIKQIEKMNTVYSEISAEKYIVMPNHIHLILTIENRKGTSRTPSPTNELVPFYVSTFKRMVGKKIGENIWERSYYDHIIRDEKDYEKIWQYIDSNAAKWEKDCFYRE
ncbi:MAG: transposase [Clostridia bacterium]|nr:transposase [Clostridia bacterium]